jgi:kynureninase
MRISMALKRLGMVVDFRGPGTIRIAPAPLYNTFHELWRAVHGLKEIVDRRLFEDLDAERQAVP